MPWFSLYRREWVKVKMTERRSFYTLSFFNKGVERCSTKPGREMYSNEWGISPFPRSRLTPRGLQPPSPTWSPVSDDLRHGTRPWVEGLRRRTEVYTVRGRKILSGPREGSRETKWTSTTPFDRTREVDTVSSRHRSFCTPTTDLG